MAGNKKPRKSFKAKQRLAEHKSKSGQLMVVDPLSYVLGGFTRAADMEDDRGKAVQRWKIRNHDALNSLRQGTANERNVDDLVWAFNMADAFRITTGYGEPHKADIAAAQDALHAVMQRYVDRGKVSFVCTGVELQALIFGMDIHDAQLDVVTVEQVKVGLEFAKAVQRRGLARKVQEKWPSISGLAP